MKKAILAFGVITVVVLSTLYFSGKLTFVGPEEKASEDGFKDIPLEEKGPIALGHIEKEPIELVSYNCNSDNPCSNPPGGMPEIGMDCCCSDLGCSKNCEYLESGSCS